ncbi:MAG TPA: hypothetical protein PK821_01730 [Victivallales bacterium]|nr:hypothetical protein [Victivallales bacterium]
MKLNMEKHQPKWNEVKERFEAWWNRSSCGRPLMKVVATREEPCGPVVPLPTPPNSEYYHTDPEYNVNKYRNFLNTHYLMAEAFPHTNVNMGPGSLAVYLGGEPDFAPSTVWYKHCIKDWGTWKFKFDPNNHWFKRHIDAIKKQVELSKGEFIVGIPDLCEGVDILSAMRDPQEFCYDLMDNPDIIKKHLSDIAPIYHRYFDAFHEIVKDDEGNCYTCFEVWGKGKTVKLQCDFSALMSPDQFDEFVVPHLKEQAKHYDRRIYHLDGPDATRHLDSVLGIEEIDALQWSPGVGHELVGDEKWFPMYDKARDCNKSLWLWLYGYPSNNEMIAAADRLVKRYGDKGIYIIFQTMSKPEADALMKHAEKDWSSK